jgi:hypothetical protein
MFERNPVDNAAMVTVAVELTLNDASILVGRAAIPHARAVHKLLDGAEPFIYVDVFGAEGTFVPKASIKALKIVTPARPQALPAVSVDANFDPYRVLGIPTGASFDDVRAAYHRLTKMYHPDVYASVTLPPEVATYLDARAKQINAAFKILKSPRANAAPTARAS